MAVARRPYASGAQGGVNPARLRASKRVMEPKDILAAFQSVVATGPVLIVANMENPDHSGTNDPITEYSPLLRAAVFAANLGAREFTYDVDHPGWKQVFDDSRLLLGTSTVADVVQVDDDHAVSCWASPGTRLERDRWMIPGGYAWRLTDFEPLARPVPMKGLQRLWTIRQNLVVTGARA